MVPRAPGTGRLAAEWRATEAIAEIEAEIPYPLSRVVTDIAEALRRRSFHDRIAEKLVADPAWAWGGRGPGQECSSLARSRPRSAPPKP